MNMTPSVSWRLCSVAHAWMCGDVIDHFLIESLSISRISKKKVPGHFRVRGEIRGKNRGEGKGEGV